MMGLMGYSIMGELLLPILTGVIKFGANYTAEIWANNYSWMGEAAGHYQLLQ